MGRSGEEIEREEEKRGTVGLVSGEEREKKREGRWVLHMVLSEWGER